MELADDWNRQGNEIDHTEVNVSIVQCTINEYYSRLTERNCLH